MQYNQAYIKLIIGLAFCLQGISLLATHVAGGTMTYRCLGNSQYEISMEFRRDCLNGDEIAPFDDPALFGVFDSNGNLDVNVEQFGAFRIPLTQNDTLFEILTTECNVISGDVCIQTTLYRDTITLPRKPGGYIIAYQRCCRNITLNNIVDPLNTGATYFVRITDRALEECNSSPVWRAWPDIFICADDTLNFLHNAFDEDGDSLVYELCRPSDGLTADDNIWNTPPAVIDIPGVAFRDGFSVDNLFGGGDPLTIDPATGQMFAVPLPLESQFLVGVCVKEYRDGELLSEVRRDFEYNVRICGRAPIAEAAPDAFVKCNSLEIEFTNNSISNFLEFDSLDFTWIFDFPDTNLISNEINPTFSYPQSGNYEVALVVFDGTCTDTTFLNVSVATEDDPELGLFFSAENCNPNTTISLEAIQSFTETVPDSNYTWIVTDANGNTSTLTGPSTTLDIGPDQMVSVSLEVTGPTGCLSTYTEEIEVVTVQEPQAEFSLSSFNCNSTTSVVLDGSVMTNTAVPEDNYIWTVTTSNSTLNATGSNPTVDIGVDQTIEVLLEVTTEEGCIDTISQSFDVETAADPTASFTFTARNCNGSTEVLLNGAAQGVMQTVDESTYVWNVIANNTTQTVNGQNVVVDISSDQVVIVEMQVSSIEGCTTTIRDTIQVTTVPFAPVFNSSVVCPGESAVIFTNLDPSTTVEVQPNNNLIIDNGNYIITNNTVSQTYTITVDNGDCQQTGAVMITVDTNPSFAELEDVIQCGDETIQLNPNGNTTYVYNWEGPAGVNFDQSAPNPTASVPTSGLFFVTISTSALSDCFAFDTIQVNRVELPTIDLSPSNQIIYCEGTEISVGATSGGELTWFDENGFVISTGATPITINGLTQSVVYTVQSVDQFGCSATETLEIQFIPAPTFNFAAESEFTACLGEPITAVVNSLDAITWTTIGGIVVSNTNELTLDALTQDSTFVITATNDLGCQSEQMVTLEVLALPETSPVPLQLGICLDAEVEFNLSSQDSITWRDENGMILSTDTTLIISNLTEQTFYFIEYINSNGCIDFDTLTIDVFDEVGLEINSGADTQIYCRGFNPEITSTVNVASDIEWFVDGVLVGNGADLIDFLPEGDFELVAVASDASGCTESDTISVMESFAEGDITGPDSLSLCLGEETVLTYNPNMASDFEIEWSPTDFTDAIGTSIVISPSETTTYSVIYTNADGCRDTTSIDIAVGGFPQQPEATTSLDEICLQESVNLDIINISGNETIVWTPSSTLDDAAAADPIATPTETTTYGVLVTDDLGCTSETSVEVRVIQPTCTESDVFIPNMFTPNADMLNDIFKPESNFIESMTLVVYDRWGEEVFSTTDINGGWDGTYLGEELTPDVYGYYFTAVCINGFTYEKQGNVTLMK